MQRNCQEAGISLDVVKEAGRAYNAGDPDQLAAYVQPYSTLLCLRFRSRDGWRGVYAGHHAQD